MGEILLPRTDGGVAVQIVLAALLVPAFSYFLIRSGHPDGAWLAVGLGTIWIAFMALRSLH